MILKLGRVLLKRSLYNRELCILMNNPKMSFGEEPGVRLNVVVALLEKFAPINLSASWDNTGLLVEPYTPRNITKILLTNDLTEKVALEAKSQNCEMIISYHPPIFTPLKSVIQSAWKEKVISLLLESRIALYSPHTSWDAVQGGVNDWLASAFRVINSTPIKPELNPDVGAGRFLYLDTRISLSEAIDKVKQHTGLKHVRVAIANDQTMSSDIATVALCAGSGASILKDVDADLYLTGEMQHHDVLDATQRRISVILTNHSDSERGFLKTFSSIFEKKLDNKVQVLVSQCDRDPLEVV